MNHHHPGLDYNEAGVLIVFGHDSGIIQTILEASHCSPTKAVRGCVEKIVPIRIDHNQADFHNNSWIKQDLESHFSPGDKISTHNLSKTRPAILIKDGHRKVVFLFKSLLNTLNSGRSWLRRVPCPSDCLLPRSIGLQLLNTYIYTIGDPTNLFLILLTRPL